MLNKTMLLPPLASLVTLMLVSQDRIADTKLDPAVAAAIAGGKSVQVIILGKTQLLALPNGLTVFAAENASANRLELRREVVARMKQIARDEQSGILRALNQKPERALWIVSAMALTLSPGDVRKAAALPEVLYIYPSTEPFRRPESPSAVSLLLDPKPGPFSTDGKRIGWNIERLGAPRVWRELGIIGEGVTVAVLDAGVNYAHADLRSHIWLNRGEKPNNGKDDDGNGYIDDVYGYDFSRMRAEVRDFATDRQHGTMTSGIIAGDGTGGIVTGVAPRARIMPLRGNNPMAAGLAYQYALENGADILSMSFSIPDLGNVRGLWRMMSDHATAAGLVLIGGAGNAGTTAQVPDQIESPKDVPSVISVAGVDSLMRRVPFSSMGPVEWTTVALYGDYPMPTGLTKPDLVAFPGPGYPVLAAADAGYVDPNRNIRGNSFSGPQGAGVAALILSAAPQLPAWRVRQIMEATARDLGEPGKDNRFGAGLLDAFAAVQEARKTLAAH